MQEYVTTPFVCGDKSEAPIRDPSINDSIMETTGRGLVRIMLIAVLVGEENAYWREGVWALEWHHGGCFAVPFARADWAGEWAGYGSRQARSL